MKRRPLAPLNQPWKLIREALKDLAAQEKNKQVLIDMGTWHEPVDHDDRVALGLPTDVKCMQCFAGCVISRRLGVGLDVSTTPYAFPTATQAKLDALDDFRTGQIRSALTTLGLPLPTWIPEEMSVVPYTDNTREEFHRGMLRIADMLENGFKTLAKEQRRLLASEARENARWEAYQAKKATASKQSKAKAKK
jgi:hypothetical protein